MTAISQSRLWNYSRSSSNDRVGAINLSLGIALAIGVHVIGVAIALSSGAGLSLQPEGGGGTGGMRVMMGKGDTGHDAQTQAAKRAKVVMPPAQEIKLIQPKPVVKPASKIKPKAVTKPKPNPKAMPKAKPVKKVQPAKSASTSASMQSRLSVDGASTAAIPATPSSAVAVNGTEQGQGNVNSRAGGAPVGQSVGAGTSKGFGLDTAAKSYKRDIHRLLLRAKRYPKTAQRLGQEGVVSVSFVIAPNGQSSAITVLKKSKYPSLNREAKALIRRVGKFPPIPASVSTRPVTFSFNIPFRLY